jgi:hypothetical protein
MYGRTIHEMCHTNSFAFISTNADLGTFVGSPAPDESFMPGHEQLRGPWDCRHQGKIRVSPGACQGLSVSWLTFIHLNVVKPDAVLRRCALLGGLPLGRPRETTRLPGPAPRPGTG